MALVNQARLNKKLIALPKEAILSIQKAMAKQADEIVRLAKNLAPVDQGDLRDSIGWTWGSDIPRGAIAILQTDPGVRPEFALTVFAGNDKAFYARFVEFGTQKMRAQPFFFPAYRASRRRAKSAIRRAVTTSARKVARGG